MLQENKKIWSSTMVLFLMFAVIYLLVQYLFQVFTQPYFWDELGVYSRSSTHLYNDGLSLLPSSVPDELSRGHPLLCPFYFATAFKLFGNSPLTAHIAAALLNILGFYFCYRILIRYIPVWFACFGTLAIFVQPLFLSQSVLVLPEMPLMVATLGAVMFYVYGKKWGAMCCLVLALQIKESALVLPIAFLLTDIMISKRLNLKSFLFYFFIPLLSFILFVLVQKAQRGYYFYPLHTSLSSFDMYYIRERWENFKHYAFHEQGRYSIWIIACVTVAIFSIGHFRRAKDFLKSSLLILPITIAGCLGFMVLNYYLSRYTMYFLVLAYIGLIVLFVKTYQRYFYLQCILIGLVFCNGIYNWNNGKVYTDVDFSYADHVKSIQLVIQEVEKPEYKGKVVGMDFPLAAVYWSENNGYSASDNVHSVPFQDSLPKKDFMVFTHPGNMADTAKHKDLTLRKELRSGYAFARIYQIGL
jgi:hypothetical protein